MSRWIVHIASTTPEEILHMLKDKYKINIYLQDKYPHDPGGKDIYKYQAKEYLQNLYENMIFFSMIIFLQIYILHSKLSSD